MTFTMNLYIPCRISPKIRVLPHQKIGIINNIQFFSRNNKMLFISKGNILPYHKSMEECNLSEGDKIFALNIESNTNLENLLNTNQEINSSQIRNIVPIFGPSYEANLKSINKVILLSQNQNIHIKQNFIQNNTTSLEIARMQDLKWMKRINCKNSWKNQLKSLIKTNSYEDNFVKFTNIEYESLKEPSCEALPVIL